MDSGHEPRNFGPLKKNMCPGFSAIQASVSQAISARAFCELHVLFWAFCETGTVDGPAMLWMVR